MVRLKRLLTPNENIIHFEVLLIALLSVIPFINISNTGIEKLTLCITFVLLLLLFFQNIRVIGERWHFLVICLNAVSICITVCLHGGFGSAVIAMNLILAAMIYNNIEISADLYTKLHLLLAVVLTFYIVTSDASVIRSTIVTDLFGNDYNSNMFAMITLAAFLHWICALFESKLRGRKRVIAFLAITCISLYYILISRSRTAMISFVVFWALFLFKKKPFDNKQFRIITVVSLMLCCVLPIVYIALANQLGSITILGKNIFSGRQIVWQSTFDIIKRYPIFGNANELPLQNVEGQFTASTHNMMLGYMKMFGIVPTITIILMLANNSANGRFGLRKSIPQFAFLAAIPCAFFESFYTNSQLYMLYAFFLLAFIKKKKRHSVNRARRSIRN